MIIYHKRVYLKILYNIQAYNKPELYASFKFKICKDNKKKKVQIMGLIVQKFGGSSVANTEKLEIVSKHIISEVDKRQ